MGVSGDSLGFTFIFSFSQTQKIAADKWLGRTSKFAYLVIQPVLFDVSALHLITP